MSDFYTLLAATASRLIEEYGFQVTVKRTTGESVDPVTGDITAGVDSLNIVNGIFKEYSNSLIDGTRILAGDRMLVLDNSFEPLPTDKVLVGNEYWDIIPPILSKSPSGLPLIYFVQVRG